MSGGGSTPTAPNLSSNVAAGNSTFGTATSDAAQTQNTAVAGTNASLANLSGVTNTANSAAGQIGASANQNLQTYGSTFAPLQTTEAQAAQNYGSNANVSRLQGQAVSGANQANQAALTNSNAALAAEGVDPASIGGAASARQAAVSGAAGVAQAGTQSAINTQQTAFGMENTANQLGTTVGQMGTAGEATAASTAEGGQSAVNSTNQTNVNNSTASATDLNAGTNANNSAVQANQAQFQDQQQVYSDQQAQQAGTGQLLGDVAGAAMMFMESGGPVPGAFVPRGAHNNLGRRAIPTNYGVGGMVSPKGALPASPIPGSTDTKPAILTPGEFVMPKDVVDFKGADHFHKMIDSIRSQKNKRQAIPTLHAPHVSMH